MYREVLLHQTVQGLDEDEPVRQEEVREEMDVGNWAPATDYEGPYDKLEQEDDDDVM